MSEHARDRRLVDLAGGGMRAFVVRIWPVRSRMKSSISALPGPVSQATGSLAVDEGDVGDAADIEHARPDAARPARAPGAMEHRHQRRALPAGGDIGGAEIVDHRDAEPCGERRAVADLDGQAAVRPVQDGLAVEADHCHFARRHAVGGEKRLDRLGMRIGD